MSLVGYASVRFRILSDNLMAGLSKFVITVTLPCLIIATLGSKLEHDMLGIAAIGAVAAFILNATSIAFALMFRSLFISQNDQGRNLFLSLSAIQNSGYLPIPLVMAVLPEEMRSQGLLLTFVYITVMGLLFWSVGVSLITEGSSGNWRGAVRKVLNPPLIALLAGLLFLIPPVKAGFSALPVLQESLVLIGNTTIPLVMIVLGGAFGERIPMQGAGRRLIGGSALLKLIVTPATALLAARVFSMEWIFGFILVMQAAMPAAMNHIVVAREYGGNTTLISRTLFVHYMLSVVTVPLFLYLYSWY